MEALQHIVSIIVIPLLDWVVVALVQAALVVVVQIYIHNVHLLLHQLDACLVLVAHGLAQCVRVEYVVWEDKLLIAALLALLK
jgi:hypothetical protein